MLPKRRFGEGPSFAVGGPANNPSMFERFFGGQGGQQLGRKILMAYVLLLQH